MVSSARTVLLPTAQASPATSEVATTQNVKRRLFGILAPSRQSVSQQSHKDQTALAELTRGFFLWHGTPASPQCQRCTVVQREVRKIAAGEQWQSLSIFSLDMQMRITKR